MTKKPRSKIVSIEKARTKKKPAPPKEKTEESAPETLSVPNDLLPRMAILALELSGKAVSILIEFDDAKIPWSRVAELSNAAADCSVAMIALRQDRDIQNERARREWQQREAAWAKIEKCAHQKEGGVSAFDLSKDPATCELCGVSTAALKEREKELEARAEARKKAEEAAKKAEAAKKGDEE
jgi:hypothetical protein